ncbi:MAG: DUF1844 domain-containing protein [Desulfobacterales bacterium]|jgi:hypothetical protein|nr:DUF1844 domain-containing protein [Desulfobacterales bacterium]
MSEEKKSFVVKDRRRFSSESQETGKDEIPEKEELKNNEPEKEAEEPKAQETIKSQEKSNRQETNLPKINFQTFILSLNSSVLVQLGIIEDPMTGITEKNLSLAKQTIDILGMLDEKTRGNLDKDEEMMLKNILYDLRMMYVREIS